MQAFKESGGIEYSADVLFGLQLKGVEAKDFDVEIAKSKTPREIELKILKNRRGRTGGSLLFEYYPKFNYFEQHS
jgi:replicative DNA helicase